MPSGRGQRLTEPDKISCSLDQDPRPVPALPISLCPRPIPTSSSHPGQIPSRSSCPSWDCDTIVLTDLSAVHQSTSLSVPTLIRSFGGWFRALECRYLGPNVLTSPPVHGGGPPQTSKLSHLPHAFWLSALPLRRLATTQKGESLEPHKALSHSFVPSGSGTEVGSEVTTALSRDG